MTDKIFVPNVGSMDEAIRLYLDVRNSIEMQHGSKASAELGNSVRGLVLDGEGTIHVLLHENVNTDRMHKRFEEAARIVQSVRAGDMRGRYRYEIRRAMVALAQYAVAVAERHRVLTPDDVYVTGRELIKSGISGVSGALIKYGVLRPYVPRIEQGIELPQSQNAPDWQTLGVEIADMKFWIDLKRLVRIFHRLTLLEQPDKPRLQPDAIGSGFWFRRHRSERTERDAR